MVTRDLLAWSLLTLSCAGSPPEGGRAAAPPAAGAASVSREARLPDAGERPPTAATRDPFGPPGVLEKVEADAIHRLDDPAAVVLLEAGEEPRAELRYRVTARARSVVDMRMDIDEEVDTGGGFGRGTESRPLVFRFSLRLEKPTAEAFAVVARVEGVFDEASRPKFPELRGSIVRYRFEPTGRVTGAEVKLAPKTPAAMGLALAESRALMQALYTIVPEEPVGVGARWQVTWREKSMFADFLSRCTYRLKARAGDELHVEGSMVRAVADPESFALGRALTSSYRSTVEARLDLSRLAPSNATFADERASTEEMRVDGKPMRARRRGTATVVVTSRE